MPQRSQRCVVIRCACELQGSCWTKRIGSNSGGSLAQGNSKLVAIKGLALIVG